MITDIPSWPTTLNLDCKDDFSLVCEKSLRNLPGKRLVCSGRWQKIPVVAKLFLDPRSAKRHWQREKTGVTALQKANITTPALLFSGQLDDQTPVLIFEQLSGAETALTIWQKLTDDKQRLELLQQLLSELAKHHRAGLQQRNLCLSNFLRSDQHWHSINGDTVDSHRFGTPLSPNDSLNNLALFFAQIEPCFDHLIETALVHYANARRLRQENIYPPLITKLSKTRTQRRHQYVRKSYHTCSEFVRHNSWRQVSVYRRNIDLKRIEQLLADPDTQLTNGAMLKDGDSTTVTRVFHPQGDWVIKRYNIMSPWHVLRRCLRPSRAWVSWGNAQRLTISGIDTPRAIAFIENRLGPLRLGAYFICENITAPDALDYFSHQPLKKSINSKEAYNFLSLFALLHKLGIYHKDCKATNFLIHQQQPWVIDLDAMREFRSRQSFLRRYKVDRKRFLANWKNQPQLQRWFDHRLQK